MSKFPANSAIRLRGVRQNNLKNFDLDLPLHRLIVITGPSGSGKSSLAFDTLFAEGQRRYIETFSPYARQFFDRMDKPQVDSIEGIPPAIAIEQRNAVRTTRSTVGTMTEICDYLKTLWPHIAQLHCRGCGQPVRKEPPQVVWQTLTSVGRASPRAGGATKQGSPGGSPSQEEGPPGGSPQPEVLITFDLALSEKLSLADSLALVAKQGYQRLLVGNELVRVDEAASHTAFKAPHATLTVVQDRLRPTAAHRARFIEACEQAYHFGKGKLTVREIDPPSSILHPRRFSAGLHCARCDLEYRDPSPALFSFNHPLGACPACKGFGRIISIDYDLAIPDRSLTLAGGAVRPWRSGFSAECQQELLRACRHFEIPTKVPFAKLPKKSQDFVVEGEPDYGKDEEHEWPRAWYGVKGYFRWLESKSYKMHVRVMLSRYRAYTTCPDCGGARLQPDALLYLLPVAANVSSRLTLGDFYALSIRDALCVIEQIAAPHALKAPDPLGLVLDEIRSRLGYLNDVGLGYLTLDRPTRTLSGGETERVSLTNCLGTRLVNTLFVLDEPSVGLHPRDTERLVRILEQLRDAGNTVVVVEHEASVMRAADQIVDLGPGGGAAGGRAIFQGTFPEILASRTSLTGQYLGGLRRIEIPPRRQAGVASNVSLRPVSMLNEASAISRVLPNAATLGISGATRHNLKNLTVEIPLNRFVCLTGVSGSGKTTLAREVLLPALEARLKGDGAAHRVAGGVEDEGENEKEDDSLPPRTPHASSLTGFESLDRVVLVDQAILGKTPRSNPAVYIGAFDDIRELFAQSEPAKQRGFNASAFSFNSSQGQCERCRGAGFEKIEMQFLSDVFIRCPDCDGRRYREHILEVKVEGRGSRVESRKGAAEPSTPDSRPSTVSWSIADLLEATVDEVVDFLSGFADSKPAQRGAAKLRLLQDVGLGYLRLGQPINTLSGGESQRLKLVSHLATAEVEGRESRVERKLPAGVAGPRPSALGLRRTLFIFDEPTTGLHFDDIRILLQVFQRLVEAGHSLLVIEHNLEVIKCADWVIDLGPEAGDGGGQIVAQGTPEDTAACEASHTGKFLREVLQLPQSQ